MSNSDDTIAADHGAASKLVPSTLAFLFADVFESGDPKLRTATWSDLGHAGKTIRSVIADQNIDVSDPEVSVRIYTINFAHRSAAFVDISYPGGDTAPDPFRFVYFVSSGKYIGFTGEVAT
jgi:hypothetical protein